MKKSKGKNGTEADDKGEFEKPFFSNSRKEQRKRDRNSFIKDVEDDDDDDDYDDEMQLQRRPDTSESGVVSVKPDDYNDEEWDIKSSIGADCTLDKKEEEDEFDKVAVGKVNVMDRTYVTEVNAYGVCSDAFDSLSRLRMLREIHVPITWLQNLGLKRIRSIWEFGVSGS